MKIVKFLVSMMMHISVCGIAYADSSSTLAGLFNAVHTMRADFVQTIYDNHGKAIQKSYGKMALQRPGKFRWEMSKPIPQMIITSDTRLWIYDPDLEQVTIKPLGQAAGESPALLLSHENTAIDKDYTVTEIQKKQPGWQWFNLIPRNADSMFASVEIGFMANQLHTMKLQDHLGHTTQIEFNHIQTNIALPSSLFIFKKPANVDVIDETRHR
jgi:outer membrane lipoprotein carrier protein